MGGEIDNCLEVIDSSGSQRSEATRTGLSGVQFLISSGLICTPKAGVNPSTPQHKYWGLLRVDPERRFTPALKGELDAAE